MIRSLLSLTRVDLGFDPSRVLTFGVNLPKERYVDDTVRPQWAPSATAKADLFLRTAIDALRGVPGVAAVGATPLLPLSGMGWGKVVTLYDRPLPSSVQQLPPFEYRAVAGDYFRAMGFRLVRGRLFTDADTLQAPLVAIVNEEFARRYLNRGQTLGVSLAVNPPARLLPPDAVSADTPQTPARFSIVGVVADARNNTIEQPADPMVYCPYAQNAEGTLAMSFAVRTDGDPVALSRSIRHELWSIDKNLPLANVTTMDAAVSTTLGRPRLETWVLAAFGALALVLATLGVYAVIAYGVAQRTREIGVRMAIGAPASAIVVQVLRRGVLLAALGVGVGMAGAVALTRTMQSMLFGAKSTDPAVLAAMGALLLATAAAASLAPALRAARIDPLTALR